MSHTKSRSKKKSRTYLNIEATPSFRCNRIRVTSSPTAAARNRDLRLRVKEKWNASVPWQFVISPSIGYAASKSFVASSVLSFGIIPRQYVKGELLCPARTTNSPVSARARVPTYSALKGKHRVCRRSVSSTSSYVPAYSNPIIIPVKLFTR